jgi:hypothetical protein
MAAGHVANRVRHGHDREPERQRNTEQAYAHVWECGGKHGASASPEDQPKRSNELRGKFSGQWHGSLLVFLCFFP